MHPDAKIAYPIQLESDATLSGRAITQPAHWENEGDGVSMKIGNIIEGREEVLWETYLDGKSTPSHRQGMNFRIPIPNQTSAIWFEVGPGPAGDYRFDGAGFENLRLESGR